MNRDRVGVCRFGRAAGDCIFDVALLVAVACLVCVAGGESIREDWRVWFVVLPWGLPGGYDLVGGPWCCGYSGLVGGLLRVAGAGGAWLGFFPSPGFIVPIGVWLVGGGLEGPG